MATDMKQNRLVPWFGSDAMEAPRIARPLDGCTWVGIPFAGGMSIVPHLKARSIVVNDIHRHVMNLAVVLSIPKYRQRMAETLPDLIYHPDVLAEAQRFCIEMERGGFDFSNCSQEANERWAVNYFICSWMGRSAVAGKKGEFKGKLPIRWSASGGDSNTRFRSAIESIDAWSATMQRCNFSCLDFREFLKECKDIPENGGYFDAPWVVDGKEYKHSFNEKDHRDLARLLSEFKKMRIVVRYGDAPLIRELYPADCWDWTEAESRTGGNSAKAEVLIIKRHVA